MHEYTARRLHDERMSELYREADARRLARQVRRGPRRFPRVRSAVVSAILVLLAAIAVGAVTANTGIPMPAA